MLHCKQCGVLAREYPYEGVKFGSGDQSKGIWIDVDTGFCNICGHKDEDREVAQVEQQLLLEEIQCEEGRIDMRLGGETAQLFMEVLIEFFEQNGGKNYLALEFGNKEKKYAINIQDCHSSKTPAEALNTYTSLLKECICQLEKDGEQKELVDKIKQALSRE